MFLVHFVFYCAIFLRFISKPKKITKMIDRNVLEELEKIRILTLLGVKTALSVEEAAVYTNLSKSHIYKLCHFKKIPHWKGGGNKFTYFNKKELEQWMLSRRVSTNDELEVEAANYTVTGKLRPAASRADAPATLKTVKGKGNGHKKTSVS